MKCLNCDWDITFIFILSCVRTHSRPTFNIGFADSYYYDMTISWRSYLYIQKYGFWMEYNTRLSWSIMYNSEPCFHCPKSEDCVEVLHMPSAGKWNNAYCHHKRFGYICQTFKGMIQIPYFYSLIAKWIYTPRDLYCEIVLMLRRNNNPIHDTTHSKYCRDNIAPNLQTR